jgi:D-cysteine desulfhydrase
MMRSGNLPIVASLDHAPRIAIGRWPTPTRQLDAVSRELGSEVWAKLEEECGAWGGNKVRKLEYLLAEARERRARTLVAYGAGTSAWAAATALHGRRNGFRVVVGLSGSIPAGYRDLFARTGTRVIALPVLQTIPLSIAAARAAAGWRNVMTLPPGGSGGRGELGCTRIGVEIARSVQDGQLPRPRRGFVALGTAGTSAGVAVGMGAAGLVAPVTAVRVAPWPMGTPRLLARHIRKLARRLESLGQSSVTAAPTSMDERWLGPGYGKPSAASEEAIALARADELELDPVYAAKAFAALIDHARAGGVGPFLFLHTSPGPLPGDD